MGLLSPEYYKNFNAMTPAPLPDIPEPTPPPVFERAENAIIDSLSKAQTEAVGEIKGDLTPEEQIRKFGGTVGSPEYLKYQSEHPYKSFLGRGLEEGIGLQPPDQETWDSMSSSQKIGFTITALPFAAGRLVTRLPRELIKTPIRFGVSVLSPWKDFFTGKSPTIQQQAEKTPLQVPWIGSVPSYWQDYQSVLDSGAGPLAATVATGTIILGDITIAASLAEATKGAFQPRSKLPTGQPVINIAPIQKALAEDAKGGVKLITKKASASEYYSLPKTVAKKYGGNPDNTFLKMTPADFGAGETKGIEISVVQTRGGALQKAKDFITGKKANVYEGDFGPEVKFESQIINSKKPIGNEILIYRGGTILDKSQITDRGIPLTTNNTVAESFARIKNQFDSSSVGQILGHKTGQNIVEKYYLSPEAKIATKADIPSDIFQAYKNANPLTKPEIAEPILGKWARENGFDGIDYRTLGKTSAKEAEIKVLNPDVLKKKSIAATVGLPKEIVSIPPRPLKGFENKPVTDEQVLNLGKISQVNKIDPQVAQVIIKSVTGKDVLGNLTQTEYVNAAQALSTFSDAAKFTGRDPFINPASQYLSPQDHFTRAVENTYPQFKVYTKGYVPMESAMKLRDVTWNGYKDQARTIFGKYADSGFGEERRLIKTYLEGDQSVITNNPVLSSQAKTEMIAIADKMRELYRETRIRFGEKDLGENYQPHIADINGIHQIYKEGSELPKELKFFADYERKGSVQVQVDDALALWDIYTKAGTNKIFVNPALTRINAMYDTLPETLRGSMKSYVQEKLGYADRLEQSLNEIGAVINRKTGLNLSPDVGRKVTEVYLNLLNSGALGSVYGGRAASVIRNTLQDPILVYPRLGAKFKAETYLDLIKPSTRKAILAEMKDKGLLETLGGPYGQELTRESTLTGKAGTAFRKVTQGSQIFYGAADNLTRASAYRQFQLQWDDAFAKYNGGKIAYPQLEKELDFNAFNPLDRNVIRQKLIAGDAEGAFNHAARDVINETNFSYARGTSSRVTFGLSGKLGTKFLRWPIEYGHTLGNWVRTGQWDKLIRWYGATTLTLRTFKDAFGIDFVESFGLNPLKPQLPPAVKAVSEFAQWVIARFNENSEEIETHKDELLRQITGLGIPAGVSLGDFNQFRKSMQKYATGDRGPNGEEFAVLSRSGSVKYWTDFQDIWKQLWGFPTIQELQDRQLSTDIRNARFDYTQKKQEVLELLQQQKFDEAIKIMEEYQIKVDADDLDKYQIPFNYRTFETLPASLKARFAPMVFPQ